MKMSFRWYGGNDSISLDQVKQIPGVTGVITTLHGKPQGEAWTYEEVEALKRDVATEGITIDGIESVHVIDSIKVADENRDHYIDNYIKSLEAIGQNDIHMVCYSFMPLFGWTRTQLAKPMTDGSTTLAYNWDTIDNIEPDQLFELVNNQTNGFRLPDWEPERLAHVKDLINQYRQVEEDQLFDNLVYFLKAIMPTCDKYDIKMGLHPDDPAWSMFGLPRIVKNKQDLIKVLAAVDDPHNGITFCSGSLGSDQTNNLLDIIDAIKGRINFVHLRNLKHTGYRSFDETACNSDAGDLDMYAIIKKLNEVGFDGVVRLDHGRNIWGEVSMPGYGLYDRALGSTYLEGLIEAVKKEAK
ncbi:mannonate dehydratase [Lacticaseibacillus paracasei NRIC 1981]|uniref:mannonate dehydratase n=1 Tax=Lacticaseibacillus paracasei TaxID=1597 RepID=UPI0005DF8F42|nr:mannonate dehydratase [Lacticaseibacillus paracasei]GAN40893.1 mannonate dehydratase [Lacticaseibacillus paracasei NRIC 1981]